MKHLFLVLSFSLVLFVSTAFAGTETIFNVNQSNSSASGSATVSFNSYNATSITISVTTGAYGASQQGGGRNYAGYAEAVIGSSTQSQNVPNGSDPMNVSASNTLTVTKSGDGSWYAGGINMGTSVSCSAFAWVDGENSVGGSSAKPSMYCAAYPAIHSSPSIAS